MNYCQSFCQTIQRLCNSGALLPPEYQQVEYLQSTGTQGIDSGLTLTDNYYHVTARLKCTLIKDQQGVRFWGSQNNDVWYTSCFPWKYNFGTGPFAAIACGGSLTIAPDVTTYINTIYDIDLTANNGQLTGEYCGIMINTTYTGSVVTNRSEGVFFCNLQSPYTSATSNKGGSAIYYIKMYTSSGIARDFIPCYRKSDSKPGMYDLVTNTFFTNIGTGEFTVGQDV